MTFDPLTPVAGTIVSASDRPTPRRGMAVIVAAGLASMPWLAPPRVGATELPIAMPERIEPVRFQTEILPMLAANCVACHNARQQEGGLSLETVAAIVAGGDSGPAVIAGEPDSSVLLVRAAHLDPDADTMPPQGNSIGGRSLTPEELGLLARWIAEGAAAGPATTAGPIAWRPLPPGTGPVLAVDVTADGRLTAAARGNRVSLFDTVSAAEVGGLVDDAVTVAADAIGAAHRDPLGALAFSPAGDRLATGSFRTIKVWRRTPPRIAPLPETDAATAVAVAATGDRVAFGLPDGGIVLIAADTSAVVARFAVHDTAVTGLSFADEDATLYSIAASGGVAATRVTDGIITGRLARPAGTVAIARLDAGRLVTAEPDHVVRIWSLPLPPADADPSAAVQPLAELAGVEQPLAAVVAVPGLPAHLLAGGSDGMARLWNADDGSVVRTFEHGGAITALAVRPDGSRLATAGSIPGVKVWNLTDGSLVAEPQGDVRLSRRLAAADLELDVDRQDVEFAKAQVAATEKDVTDAGDEKTKAAEAVIAAEKALAEKTEAVAAAERAKAEAGVAVEAARAAVPLADEAHDAAMKAQAAATAVVETTATSLAAYVKAGGEAAAPLEAAVAAAQAAKEAAAAAVAQAAAQIERAKGRIPEVEKLATDAATAVTKAGEERGRAETTLTSARRAVEFAEARVARTQDDLPRRQAELASAEQRLAADTHGRTILERHHAASRRPVTAVAFTPDGSRLAALETDGRLALIGGADGGIREVLDAARPTGGSASRGMVGFVGPRLVVAGAGATATAWDLSERWELERTIGGEATPPAADDEPGGPPVGIVTALAFSADGAVLASGSGRASRSGEIKLWDVANGLLARTIVTAHSDTVMALAFSRRGDLLASGAADRFVKVHSVEDGSLVRSFEGHTGHVLGVAWQAHGRRIASAGADNAVKVWDMITGEQQRTITGPKKEVTGVRFVAATDELVAAAGDPLVRLYNVGNGAVVREFGNAGEFVQALAASPSLVVVGGQDGRVRLWNLGDATPLHTIEVVPARP